MLKFPRGRKIAREFRTEHAQPLHLKIRAEKREKKMLRIFNFLDGISREKMLSTNQI